LAPIAREGLGLMAGLFWDLGDPDLPKPMLQNTDAVSAKPHTLKIN
jgi:hypothetical protein